jgi:mannose-6-phosphate isomerase-like protein (cupin superfamily)
MQGFYGHLGDMAGANTDFRRVIYTGPHLQVVLMSLKPDEAIGPKIHETRDQFFRIEKGQGRLRLGAARISVCAGDGFVVPAGMRHNLTNTGKKRLRLYTIYSPPNHADGLIAHTKAKAMAVESQYKISADLNTANKVMTIEGGPAPSMQEPQT